MKWIPGGPDLPPELLQALEDGNLIFFCGAGVSYPAGLPTFQGLVERTYQRLSVALSGDVLEFQEFERKNYDRVFGLLERRMPPFVRKAVIEELTIGSGAVLSAHEAILELATTRDGVCRLVTTNFDQGFELASKGKIAIDAAPRLPAPKRGSWKGIVHLHGLISERDPDGKTLVLTSGDFGLAYLTEGWASRFIGELFRNFTVLFVGYSVDDPVVRYMMDAFAADRSLGQEIGAAYILAGTTEVDRDKEISRWQAKGVRPLLYDSSDNHRALHVTLERWADCHKNGLLGKEGIIRDKCSSKTPIRPYQDDPEISQVLWATFEPTGHSARVFAALEPVPPLDWLDVFEEQGVLKTSHSGYTSVLVDAGFSTSQPNPLSLVARALVPWLIRHLHDPQLLNWVLRSGASLHPDFRDVLHRHLTKPTSLPPGLSQIWHILANPRRLIKADFYSSYALQQRLSAGYWDLGLKQELIYALTPEITLKVPYQWPETNLDESRISSYADADVVLRDKHAPLLYSAINKCTNASTILATLTDDITSLLKEVMELLEMIQQAHQKYDPSYLRQPSISSHEQNSHFHPWVWLIELLRDSWRHLLQTSSELARTTVERWRYISYPVFRRMCMYAMAESSLYSPDACVNYLMEDEGWWLWSTNVSHEKFRLLQSIGSRIRESDWSALITAILAGPPRTMFRDDLDEETFRGLSDRMIWHHLKKLQSWRYELPQPAIQKLQEVTAEHPDWRLPEEGLDEFPVWMKSGWGGSEVKNIEEFVTADDADCIGRLSSEPIQPDELERWKFLTKEQPQRAAGILVKIAQNQLWPSEVWKFFLIGVVTSKESTKQWPVIIDEFVAAPATLFEQVENQTASLLREVAPSLTNEQEERFWKLWDRVCPYAFAGEDGPTPSDDPVSTAINIPPGILAEALLYRFGMQDETKSLEHIWQRLTEIADGLGSAYIYGRVILASRLAWLHVRDSAWTESHLVKYFDWDVSGEAVGVWQGYLWQPRITPDLWRVLKKSFLTALREKKSLGDAEDQISILFGCICIDYPDWLSAQEISTAFESLDAQGRGNVAQVISWRMQAAGETGADMWNGLIGPWIERHWPKDISMIHHQSAIQLAIAAAHSGSAFPAAVELVSPFFTRAEDCLELLMRLAEGTQPENHPIATVKLLHLVVDTNYAWPQQDLRGILQRISAAEPEISVNPGFRALDEYLRTRGF